MAIVVREANLGDAAAIAVVNIASWEAAYRGLAPDAFLDGVTLAERTAHWDEVLTTGVTRVLVTVADGELAGYCSMDLPSQDEDSDDHTARIRAFYVRPASFRGGIGSTMMTNALGLLARCGFREVTLWVLTGNTNARAFYARQDFMPDGAVSLWLDHAEQIRLRRPL